jgi:hypothetical protein
MMVNGTKVPLGEGVQELQEFRSCRIGERPILRGRGVLECWSVGVLEYWSDWRILPFGMLAGSEIPRDILQLLHLPHRDVVWRSIFQNEIRAIPCFATQLFHYPTLQCSNTPILLSAEPDSFSKQERKKLIHTRVAMAIGLGTK